MIDSPLRHLYIFTTAIISLYEIVPGYAKQSDIGSL